MNTKIDEALAGNKVKVEQPSKKVKNELVNEYLKSIREFESDRVELAKNSAKNAWKIVAVFGAITLLAIVAVVGLTPLKSVEITVLRVNDTDGSVSVLKPLSDIEPVSYGDVLDKYWARKFIISRNSYEWETVQDNYNLVSLMSEGVVLASYKKYIKAPSSPVETFGDKKRIKIKIQDVTFLPTNDTDRKLAQVRFSRDVINTEGVSAIGFKKTFWNATITFDYLAKIKTADEREVNPLGFRVTSYTEDRVL